MVTGTLRLLGLPAVVLVIVTTGVAAAQPSIDTVGFTDRDRQVYGPALRYIVNDTLRGVHAVWKDGYGDIRYNFRPRRSRWRWPGGIAVNQYPRNLGSLDVDLTTGRPIVGTDYIIQTEPWASYFSDSAAGRGLFTERLLLRRFRNVLPGTSRYGTLQFAAVRDETLFVLFYFSGMRLAPVGPFPGHSLAASKQSGRFGFIWTNTDHPACGALYLKETPNNGMSWYETANLSDSAPGPLTRSPLGGSAVYDSIRLYLVTAFYDGRNPNRSEIWLYAKYETPAWRLVHRFSLPDSSRIGDNALACCRPSIARNPYSAELYVAWEQFDAGNVDSVTELCRADVWASRSRDGGRTWGAPIRLTQPDETSKRFPFLAEVADDTLRILFFADRAAGFWEQGQGPRTVNPVLYLRFPAGQLPTGIAEQASSPAPQDRPSMTPSVSVRGFDIDCPDPTLLEIYSRTGQKLVARKACGVACDLGVELPAGVYFIRIVPADNARPSSLHRVVKLR